MKMKCPACGAAKLIRGTRNVPYTYKGEATTIRRVTGDFCPACAELVLDAVQADRFGAAVRAFNKQVNAAIVDPGFCLLYTSPSPRDRTRSRMPSSA